MDRVVGSSVFLCRDRSQGQTVCLRLRAVLAGEINTPGRWLCPSPWQHSSTREVHTAQFIMGGVSHAELLQTTPEWIMGSHAKLRNKGSPPSHLWRGSRAGSQARGLCFAIMEEGLVKQKVEDLGRSLWRLVRESRRNQPWRCDGW